MLSLVQERDQAVQKRAYKALAFVCSARHDFTVPHLKEVLETLLAGVTSSLSAAKRYRLQCLQVAHTLSSYHGTYSSFCALQRSLQRTI